MCVIRGLSAAWKWLAGGCQNSLDSTMRPVGTQLQGSQAECRSDAKRIIDNSETARRTDSLKLDPQCTASVGSTVHGISRRRRTMCTTHDPTYV